MLIIGVSQSFLNLGFDILGFIKGVWHKINSLVGISIVLYQVLS